MTVRIVVLRSGEAPASVRERHGGFLDLFRSALGEAQASVQVIEEVALDRGEHDPLLDLTGVHGVVMTGSPAMVAEDTPWMRWSVRQVQRLIADEVPYLGVCFGHQILGVAVGADVGPNPRGREIGTTYVSRKRDDDALVSALPRSFRAQVSHADVIRDTRGRLEVLAEAPHDPHHVVRAGPRCWGVQFHPEFTDGVTRDYLSARREIFDRERGPGSADARLAEVVPTPESRSLLARFVDVVAPEFVKVRVDVAAPRDAEAAPPRELVGAG